ncbi:fused MFS/spermidine synthase, partial [Myxococcota bacterium]|nr:fused MFS/spermidine synthase [Myxococcota bacterium]
TVVLKSDGFGWKLMTNGLPESTIEKPFNPPDSFHPAQWLSLLPVLNRPDTESLLVIGLGGGNTAGAITPGLERVDVIELEPEVVRANRLLADRRMYGDPLADPRVSLHYGDARGALMLTDRQYDGIVSQPSHPWTSGASHLYTQEFFELVKERLTPDGVFVQWIGMAFVDEALVRSLLNTLNQVFPYVETYRPFEPALLFVASNTPLDVSQTVSEALALAPEQLARVGVLRPEHVGVALSLDSEGTKAAGAGAPLNTDDHNLLATSAWRIGDRAENRKGVVAMLAEHDPLAELDRSWESAALAQRLAQTRAQSRAVQLLSGLEGAERPTAAGFYAYEQGGAARAARLFERARKLAPHDREARAGWILTLPEDVQEGDVSPTEWAFVQAWLRMRSGDTVGISDLEEPLASIEPDNMLFEEATRMRVAWRIDSGDGERAQEARELVDLLLARGARPEDYVLRAEAAAAADEPDQAWATLARARAPLQRVVADRDLIDRARAVVNGLPERVGSRQIVSFYEGL